MNSESNQTAENPGHGFGVAGFVLAFVGMHILGLILSIIGYRKSTSAGLKNGLALAGIWLNAIFMTLTTIGILAAVTIVSYAGVTNRANTTKAQTNAAIVQKVGEAFNADEGRYPDTITDFIIGSTSTKLPTSVDIINKDSGELNAQNGLSSVSYEYTGKSGQATGGRVQYWDYTNDAVSATTIYLGDASYLSDFNPID